MAQQVQRRRIRFLVDEPQHWVIRLAAASQNTSMSEFVRGAVLIAASKEMRSFKPPEMGDGPSEARK